MATRAGSLVQRDHSLSSSSQTILDDHAEAESCNSLSMTEEVQTMREVHFAALRTEVLWFEGADVCERPCLWAQSQELAAKAERVRRTDYVRVLAAPKKMQKLGVWMFTPSLNMRTKALSFRSL